MRTHRALRSLAALGLTGLVAGSASAATPPDGLTALILAADSFVGDQCPGLSIDAGLSSATLRAAGQREGDATSPKLKAEVAAWLTEWRGNPQAACDGLLAQFGSDGRMVRNLIRRGKKGAWRRGVVHASSGPVTAA
jgi:hypothetical protein